MLRTVHNIPINLNWDEIINYQTLNLKNGINRVGIPDLIILQNAINNDLELYSADKHFKLMEKIHKLKLYKFT